MQGRRKGASGGLAGSPAGGRRTREAKRERGDPSGRRATHTANFINLIASKS